MDFYNWNNKVNYYLTYEHRNKRNLKYNTYRYKFYRNKISPKESALYLNNIIQYKDIKYSLEYT